MYKEIVSENISPLVDVKCIPISAYQKRFFVEWANSPNESTYNVSFVYKICGNLNKTALKFSCDALIQRHEILHARFNDDGSECYYLPFNIHDIYNEEILNPCEEFNIQIRRILDQPFNLIQKPLIRFHLLVNPNDLSEYYFIINVHHIVADLVMGQIIAEEISYNYNQFIHNPSYTSLNSIPISVIEAVNAEQRVLTNEYNLNAEKFWLDFISDVPFHLDFPCNNSTENQCQDRKVDENMGEFIYFEFDEFISNDLRKYAKKNKTTIFNCLAAVYSTLLSKFCNQEKFLLSYPINLRPKGFAGVAGSFVNNILLKIQIDKYATLNELIQSLNEQRKEIKHYQHYPFIYSVNKARSDLRNKKSYQLNVDFCQANLNSLPIVLDDAKTESIDISCSNKIFVDFGLQYDDENNIRFKLRYKKSLFTDEWITSFLAAFKLFILKIANNRSNEPVILKDYCVLGKKDYQKIIYDWNQTTKQYNENQTVHRLFEEQVKKTPKHIAVVYDGKSLSYEELNHKSNQLARYLKLHYNVENDEIIALCLDRSEHILISILAILKSGGAYVPIDPSLPAKCIQYILEETKAKVVLVNGIYEAKINDVLTIDAKNNAVTTVVLSIDSQKNQMNIQKEQISDIGILTHASHLAYVMFTSGTIGTLQGVMVEHQALLTYTRGIIELLGISELNKSVIVSDYNVDQGYTGIYPLLLSGGEVHISNKDKSLDGIYLARYIKKHKINLLKCTPSYFEGLLLSSLVQNSPFVNSFTLVLEREDGSKKLLSELSRHPYIQVINHYGSSETTIGSVCNPNYNSLNPCVIGKPLLNVQCYVLDTNLNPVPLGSIGELYIAGLGLARGYLNQPELTARCYIANPFRSEADIAEGKNKRIYKTGDLVKFLPNGNLEHIGCKNRQVKVRGYTVDLGKVEKVLMQHEEIKNAVVIAKETSGDGRVIAYMVANGCIPSVKKIEAFLAEKLPNFMLPERYIFVSNMPLNTQTHKEIWAKYMLQFESIVTERQPFEFELNSMSRSECKTLKETQNLFHNIDNDLYRLLKKQSQYYAITTSVFIQFAWHKVLHLYKRNEITVSGTMVSGCNTMANNIEASVELSDNSLPLIHVHLNQCVLDSLYELQQQITFLNENSGICLLSSQENDERLFDSLFVHEDYPIGQTEVSSLNSNVLSNIEKLGNPLTLLACDKNNKIQLQLRSPTELFDIYNAQQFFDCFNLILEQIIHQPKAQVSDLYYLNKHDYSKIIYKWNKPDIFYSKDKTIHRLFEEQALRTPNRIALIFENKEMSYKELNESSNQLARFIRKQYPNGKLKPDTLIAICIERSLEMVIGILGILKAGGAYAPIDPNYPLERIGFMLEDTKSSLLLTQKALMNVLIFKDVYTIALDTKPYRDESVKRLVTSAQATDLAYVIYTSGTTGYPKGVMLSHSNVMRLFKTTEQCFNFNQEDVWTLYHSYVFDFSVWEIWGALFYGGKLIVPSHADTRDMNYFYQLCIKHNVTILNQTPSAFGAFSEEVFTKKTHILSLRYIFFGGEILRLSSLERWWQHMGDTKPVLVNMYGITETTVHVTYKKLFASDKTKTSIGKALDHLNVYVLDKYNKPLPIGVIGELHISGAGLARGYLNDPGLTQERFIPNPFASEVDKASGYTTLYKTGDLVRWLPDGDLEYVGRDDFQVKIRGRRIELGEIEQALSTYPKINQGIVLAHTKKTNSGEHSYLVAYYISPEIIHESTIVTYLSKYLPDYMVPKAYVQLESLPLTVNGKLDVKALPIPNFNSQDEGYIAPRNELESKIYKIWRDVLGLERIGLSDDFFRLGGDSIQSIQVSTHLQRQGIACSVRDILMYRTIEQLAQGLEQVYESNAEQGVLSGIFTLLPIQSWFFKQQLPNEAHYNQSFLVRVPALSLERLNAILPKLVEHHDMLRTHFIKSDGEIKQVYGELLVPEIKTLDMSLLNEKILEVFLTHWQASFNIYEGPLWQIGYITGYSDGSARLYFAFHHLIIDAVSWRILIEDIKRLYTYTSLAQKSSSYRQWTQLIANYPNQYPKELIYWQAQQVKTTTTPVLSKNIYRAKAILNTVTTKQLLSFANQVYHTEINDLLLTALAYTLQEWLGDSEYSITLEGHGRETLDNKIDVSHTLGWFTIMFPVKLGLQSTISESICMIKETLRAIPNKGIGFGAFKCQESLDYDLPPITFNYLGQFDSNSGDWQLVEDSSGVCNHKDNSRPSILNIDGLVLQGELSFTVSTYVSQTVSNQVALSYEKHLKLIIEHCMAQARTFYTPSDFSTVHLSSKLLNNIQEKDWEIEAIYPANSLQQGFIYHALSQEDDDAYRMQLLLDYENAIDVERYKKAWTLAIETYPILRTYFNWDESIIQIIRKTGQLNFKFHDISFSKEQKKLIRMIQEQERQLAFNLKEPTLLRLNLIKLNDLHYVLLKTTHHSILDGWSTPILLDKVHVYYEQLSKNRESYLVIDQTYFKAQEYIGDNKENANVYWQKKIHEFRSANDLNVLLSQATDLNTYRKVELPKEIVLVGEDSTYQKLKYLSLSEGVTLNVLLQFAWHKLIQIYTKDSQTIVGTTVSGRAMPIKGIESSVGLYINTLPLCIDWDGMKTIREYLYLIEEQTNEINEYSFAQLSELQSNGQRLFHSLIVFENYPIQKSQEGVDTSLSIKKQTTISKLDYLFGVILQEIPNKQLNIELHFDGLLLSETKAKHLLEQLIQIIHQLPEKMDESDGSINLLFGKEYSQVIYEWNQTQKFYAEEKTIQGLFEEQVLSRAKEVAIVYKDRETTYQALNERANQLAHYLKKTYGIKRDDLVAFCLDNSDDMLVVLLGILKAGVGYVPIDPKYPDERINYILRDIGAKVVLTSGSYVSRLSSLSKGLDIEVTESIDILDVGDGDYQNRLDIQSIQNPDNHVSGNQIAYVLYTSGTTGKPKGVMIEHRSVHNYIMNVGAYGLLEAGNIVDFSTSIGFDLTVTTTLGALCHGGKVVIYSGELQDTNAYKRHLQQHRIEVIKLIPSYFELLIDFLPNFYLKKVILGGEQLSSKVLEHLRMISVEEKVELPELYDEYGPTEATVGTCIQRVNLDGIATIGKPYSNYTTYVLSEELMPVPIGAMGELYIGGDGLARGYLNQSALTQQFFIENPFQSASDKANNRNTRLYKTGDLVRYEPDGQLIYRGRRDFQVKIRGNRVELSEIEHALICHGDVKEAVVLVRDDLKSKQLFAYIVAQEFVPSELELKEFLKERIPNYMVPEHYIFLGVLPLTVNGKIDRQALLHIEYIDKEDYLSPRSELEKTICEIYAEVLSLETGVVGINQDFFRLGGDSIIAIRLLSKLNQRLQLNLRVKDIFMHSNIMHLSEYIVGSAVHSIEHTSYGPFSLIDISMYSDIEDLSLLDDIYPASYLQTGMLFESDMRRDGTYHDINSYQLKLSFDYERFINIWELLVTKHDLLRARFVLSNNAHDCMIYKKIKIEHTIYYDAHSDDLIKKESLTDFDYDKAGLFRLLVNIYTATNTFDLHISFHHAIADGWSMASLVNEFVVAYQSNALRVEKGGMSYAEFVAKEQSIVTESFYLDFWKAYLNETVRPRLNWKHDIDRSENGLYRTQIALGSSISDKIYAITQQLNVSVDSLFLFVYLVTLSKFLGEEDITIGLTVHNRLEQADGDKLFGMFLNQIPFRFNVSNFLEDTHQGIRAVFSEKLKLYTYKHYPYGKLKAKFGYDLYQFGFNFVNFHIMEESRGHIVGVGGYEKISIPFTMNVGHHSKDRFDVVLIAHDDFIDEAYLHYLGSYLEHNLKELVEHDKEFVW